MANGNNKAAPAAQAPAAPGVAVYTLSKKGQVARVSSANAAQWAAFTAALAANNGSGTVAALAAGMAAQPGSLPVNACLAYTKYLVRLGWLAPTQA